MAFTLPDLPFAKDALGDHMSAETLEYHHGKHHKAYVDKTNGMLGEDLEGANLTTVIKRAKEAGNQGLFNNAAQIWNHSFFWLGLAPEGSTKPSDKLQAMIDSDFGSTDKLLEALQTESANHFASGWGWLILNNGKLEVTSLHDADSPVAHGMTPLFTVDVWEHAYYIDYRNARPDYLKSVLHNIVNWDFVSHNLDGQGVSRADQLG
ncbi:superoxide dismutase [Sphingomicrobium astaxanthinifaciens]|uniref:superoxide dismutase n=1 Tax=Sphingomicrobium astaxanthinifaciens TaxID=1227949 RepID=UPI001FCBE42F|nr:superoxide dismutase [Sphingomicrobium astaxanthinifaciens]MCJ7422267.1 superoxide dismutase [Sphingomicrobium astaxanthinifaciens]